MQLSKEMKPTKGTIFSRRCFSYQFVRFISLTSRIAKVALFPPKH
mgnify:CR=1 FL=1